VLLSDFSCRCVAYDFAYIDYRLPLCLQSLARLRVPLVFQ
jgi:hypothetical protein